MSLIEGVGDEVTAVIGLLLGAVILILAWISTHSRDIPFINLIVVELRQRRHGRVEVSPISTPPTEVPSPPADHTLPSHEPAPPQTEPGLTLSESAQPAEPVSQVPGTEETSDVTESPTAESHTETRRITEENERLDTPVDLTTSRANGPSGDEICDPETVRARRLQFFTKKSSNGAECTDKTSEPAVSPASESRTQAEPLPDRSETDGDSRLSPPQQDTQKDSFGDRVSPHYPDTREDSAGDSVSPHHPDPQEDSADDTLPESDQNRLRIRLKYLNDTQRLVHADPGETVGDFRRVHFAPELAENKLVRFIFNGQDLRNDASTLQACNLQDNSVVHCLITQIQQTSDMDDEDATDVDLSALMFPLFAVILGMIWYFRVMYRQYFNTMSTFSLVGITGLFILAYVATFRTARGHEHLE